MNRDLPSRELTYHPQTWHFEDDVPFPQVGYVSFLEGTPPKTTEGIPNLMGLGRVDSPFKYGPCEVSMLNF